MTLNTLLLLLPISTIILGYVVYKFQGKRQLISMDAVQFFYTFFVAPMIFVWFKLMLFLLLRTELGESISVSDLFIIDTIFSVLFLFLYAFISMHSLTKSFRLRKDADPLYDLFHHSEYIHLWLSHRVIISFGFIFSSLISVINLFFPLAVQMTNWQFYFATIIGFGLGPVLYIGILMMDPRQSKKRFLRFAKFIIAIFAVLQMMLYAIISPSLSGEYIVYWVITSIYISLAVCASLTFKSRKAVSVFEKAADIFRHFHWGINIDLWKN